MKLSRKLLSCVSLALLFSVSSIVSEGNAQTDVKSGFYVGTFLAHASVDGDFNDTIFYSSGFADYDVPKVEEGGGFGFAMGGRFPRMAVEMLYQRTVHDTHSSFVDIGDQTAYYNSIDFNFKLDLAAQTSLRPYFLVGFGIPWITIENSKYDGLYSDETFYGIAGNLGGGLAYYFTPQLCINGEAIYRWASFTQVDSESLDDHLSSEGPIFRIGMSFTF